MSRADFPRQHARTRRFTLGAPRGFRVSPDGQRVAFLRSLAGDDPINRLWVHDVAGDKAEIVADPVDLLGQGDDSALPPEERARRERARESGGGIVSYTTDPAVTGAVYSLSGKLYTTDLLTGETARLPSTDGVFDPRPDPTGATIAYISDGDLRVTSLEDDDRLIVGSDDPNVTYGLAEFVAAEEMRRSRGYWWSPAGDQLLVARADTTKVPQWHIASPISPETDPHQIAYPAAGAPNAHIRLEVHRLSGASAELAWNPTGSWEYLANASWAPRDTITLVVQTRDQRTMAVLSADAVTGECSEVYRWIDDRWIDIVAGTPTWIGGQVLTVEDRGAARRLVLDGHSLTPDELQVRQVLQADHDGVLISASTEATDVHLFHVSPDGAVNALTTDPGVHTAATAGNVIVMTSAGMGHDGERTIVVDSGTPVGSIESVAETPVLVPNVVFHRAGKSALNTAVVLPEGADRDTPLPVLLDPYGGPHAQRVQLSRGLYGASQWFADQGFAVVIIDGRGTPGRGPEFERAVWGDLAQPVLDDQVEGLEAVAADYPGMDLGRVGIRGWSFGGYLAALAVLRRPDRFHAAIAGAPVTDWRLYDTHYTERYLGHPVVDLANYERTDLTAEASSLTRPLLLIHGLADDNVVAAHTLSLSQALLEAGRPHQVLPLSGITHMTPQEVVAENLLKLQLAFLVDALGGTVES
jgi:dipeptidyl-peptidase-4